MGVICDLNRPKTVCDKVLRTYVLAPTGT
ncbi:hypothetical protein CBM2633_A40315 [Cupriavidus taiwanensis]|nr:hypothetical protein CBM2626_A50023 [Cupriavidus taiwanensis]SPA13557.1 hypothetical protein CBM2633_A40315 [Cupriavidus taiwanensis]